MKPSFDQPLELGRDRDVAKELNVSRPTVWRYVSQGIIPKPIKLSTGCTRFDMKAVRRSIIEKGLPVEIAAMA